MTADRRVPEVHLHIGGDLRAEGSAGRHQHVFPATGEVQGFVPMAGPVDVDSAVKAAQKPSRCGVRGSRPIGAASCTDWGS